MSNFEKNVFINCPFGPDYRQLQLSLIFTVKYLGYNPQISSQASDAGTARLENIVNIIEQSKFGIHDLSIMTAEEIGEHARMNMPFELGIDLGCKKFKPGKHSDKKTLVLEKTQYSHHKGLSDLSGSDAKYHDNEPGKLIKAVRDWFVTIELGTGVGPTKISGDFNEFTSFLEESLIDTGHEKEEFLETPIPEIMTYMDKWFDTNFQTPE